MKHIFTPVLLAEGVQVEGAECTRFSVVFLCSKTSLNLAGPPSTDPLANFLSFLMDFFELRINCFDMPLMWSIIRRLIMKMKPRPKTSQTMVKT